MTMAGEKGGAGLGDVGTHQGLGGGGWPSLSWACGWGDAWADGRNREMSHSKGPFLEFHKDPTPGVVFRL